MNFTSQWVEDGALNAVGKNKYKVILTVENATKEFSGKYVCQVKTNGDTKESVTYVGVYCELL